MNPAANPILSRWADVWSSRPGDAAIYAENGSILRTFAAVEEESLRWTESFSGLPPRSVIALQLGNAPEWPAVLLGAWRAGGVVLPMDFDLDGTRRDRAENLAGARLRLAIRGGAVVRRDLPAGRPEPWADTDLLKLTSGTSAEPRAVRFAAAQLLADGESVCGTMGLKTSDRNYGAIAFSHSYGFSNLITPLVCRGIPLVAAKDLMPRALAEGLAASGATVFPGVPALFRALGTIRPHGDRLRLAISAGAPLPAGTARSFCRQWGVKVHSFYGASECGGICYDADDDPEVPEGYIGGAMQGVLLHHAGGMDASPIRVESAAVGQGYFPGGKEDGLGGGRFAPADLLRRERDGYVLAGRVSDAINVAGRKVNPFEVESVLAGCPGVVEAAAFGVAGGSRGEDVAACVVGSVTEAALRAYCARRLPAWQVPKHWFFVEALPVNARGKLSRAELRERFG